MPATPNATNSHAPIVPAPPPPVGACAATVSTPNDRNTAYSRPNENAARCTGTEARVARAPRLDGRRSAGRSRASGRTVGPGVR